LIGFLGGLAIGAYFGAGLSHAGGGKHTPKPTPIETAIVAVDGTSWNKTLGEIEGFYGEACNEAVLKFYQGSRARGLDGYVCVPFRNRVTILKDGKPVGVQQVAGWWTWDKASGNN